MCECEECDLQAPPHSTHYVCVRVRDITKSDRIERAATFTQGALQQGRRTLHRITAFEGENYVQFLIQIRFEFVIR